MQTVEMEGEVRVGVGKGVARQLRMRGRIPSVLYGAGKATPLTLDPKEIKKALCSVSGENTLITLKLAEGPRVAILRDHQRDPITGAILHADLFEIAMDKPLDVKVPVEVVGTAIGVKDGGILQVTLREVHLRCLPARIPDRITVDVSALKINQAIHIKDLQVEAEIALLDDPGQSVVAVMSAISEEKLQALLTTVPKEGAEPEVLSAKAPEEETAVKGKAEAKGKTEPKKEEKAKK